MLEVRPPPVPDLPPITQTTFLTCRAQYPGGPNRCVSVSSLSARPSPFNGRVGIHNFTFEACSSFTRVTACKIARPPKGGLLSRGFDPASYPTKPLGSYHVVPTTTWMDPPSTGDLRRWGARRVEEGRVTGAYWQPVVSLPRSSNWTCPFRTSSFPTGFTAAPTRAVHTTMVPCDGTEDFSLRTATQRDRKVISVTRCCRLIVNHRSVSSFTSTPEARVLPSAGITQHPRYRDPLRLPDRPSSYRGCWRCDLHQRRISPNYPDRLPCMPCSVPRRTEQVRVGFFPVRAAFPV